MIILKVLFITELIVTVNCQNTNTVKVIDRFVKNGYTGVAKQYCPAIGVCSEGTHVMCMYYDAENPHGPMCHGVQNVTMMPEFAERILEIINEIRSRTAQGVLHDKNGKNLPKGYGIFKVVWEEELATFAQVWANQCIMAKDKCHASRQFPDPGQIGGVYRFTYDDKWDVISTKKFNIKFAESGFTHGRVLYAIYYILRTQFSSMLKIITPDIISNITDQHVINNNAYLQLFFGNIRHVGCGVSAFTEYVYTPDKKSIYNSVFLVCNYSQRLYVYDQLYLTEKPTEEGYSKECGCPPGFAEDTDLLCYETVCEKHCKFIPDTVVLPIFNIEDRPYRENPRYRHYNYTPMTNVLDLGIIRNPGVAKNHVDLENIMINKDEDFIESKINNNYEENMTENTVPIRRNKPIGRPRRRRRKPRPINENVSRKNFENKNSRDDILNLLNKLQNVIGNIGAGDKKRRVMQDKVANIYRKLTSRPNGRKNINENKINHANSMFKQSPASNYRKNVYDNHNTALQTRPINNMHYNQNKRKMTFDNGKLDNTFRNDVNIYNLNRNTALQSRNYNQNLQQYPTFNNAMSNNKARNNMDAYISHNTALQIRPFNDRNYNQNVQQDIKSNFDYMDRLNGYDSRNAAIQTKIINRKKCHQNFQQHVPNNAMIRNTYDIRNEPLIYPDGDNMNSEIKTINCNNRDYTYDIREPRRHYGNDGGVINLEVDRLLRYNNREEYRNTL